MRRGTLLLAVAIASALVPTAASANVPDREVVRQDDVVITGGCVFPVLAHIDGVEIHTTFFDREGNPVKLHGTFPGNTVTLTNLETSTSVTLNANGLFTARAERDGSTTIMVTGHGPFVPHPVTGEPGIWYLSGRARATLDADGVVTSVEVSGTLVNLCGRLAA
ncbi:MAG TPA: hypothetical protein VFT27_12160 [Actinomycetota bacterium]|nr:hypothetical protein [Actinomycetota bacterium]